MKISMRSFLLTGHFGAIRIGDSMYAVHERLGIACNPVWQRGGKTQLFKYGDIEFHFQAESDKKQKLWLIYCDQFEVMDFPLASEFDRWFFDRPRSFVEVEAILAEAGMKFTRRVNPCPPPACFLHLESGVELLFDQNEALSGFQFAPALRGKAETRG